MADVTIENEALKLKIAQLEAHIKTLEYRLYSYEHEVSYADIRNGSEMNYSDSKSNY
jgi:hypothetical protein